MKIFIIVGLERISDTDDINDLCQKFLNYIESLYSSEKEIEIHYYFQDYISTSLEDLANSLGLDVSLVKQKAKNVFLQTNKALQKIKLSILDKENGPDVSDCPHKRDFFCNILGHYYNKNEVNLEEIGLILTDLFEE